ncbi:Peptidase C13 domain containing protein [Aphelenchoides bicaudatus]|nr:Peptidase C13 domain containing protein [Aphelenchoides bicaudatus]
MIRLLIALLAFSPCISAEIHAVLLSATRDFEDYHHEANVAHAFHLLKDHGVKEDNIIVMSYDGIVNDKMNPFPGKLFNKPNSQDLYKDLKIDYNGENVSAQNMLAILTGDVNALNATTGGERVLKSTKDDKVFVYSTGHGGKGFLSFKDTADLEYALYAKELIAALHKMNEKNMYSELVYYYEACYSESMFVNQKLPPNMLVVVSANKDNQTMGVYCNDQSTIQGICMTDEFSAAWMEDSDVKDLNSETIKDQFETIKQKTISSAVLKYGDEDLLAEIVGNFQGTEKAVRT